MSSSSEKTKRSLHIMPTPGRNSFVNVTYLSNTRTSLELYGKALMPEYDPYTIHSHHLIVPPCSHIQKPTKKLLRNKEFKRGRYIGPCTCQEVESLIGPFQSSPLSLIPKPSKFRPIFHARILLPLHSHPLITQLTLTCIHVHGATLQPYVSQSIIFPQPVPKHPSVMSLKRIEQ